eukprot:Lithocolla_globosa_v1_NODE_5313_length_1262_cov_1066.448219.p1 type:complete len:374 gc:universal NODE_5313_length_1262_cov_1066.448219:1155-34(-)
MNGLTEGGFNDLSGYQVRIAVRGRTAILHVTTSVQRGLAGDTDRAATVGNTPGEVGNGGSLVETSQTTFISFSVHLNVFQVLGAQSLASGFNNFDTTFGTHFLCGVVGVATSTVPVSGDGLGVQSDNNVEFFGNLVEDEARHPELVTLVNADTGTNLVFPLSQHDFGVGTANLDASKQASFVVGLNNVTSSNIVGTNTTVVRTLRTGETILGPTKRTSIGGKHGVFLLNSGPNLGGLVFLKDGDNLVAVVGNVRSTVMVKAFSQDQNVVSLAERITENGNRLHQNIGIFAFGLFGGRTIKIPDGQSINGPFLLCQGAGLTTSGDFVTRNPNVGGHNDIFLGLEVDVVSALCVVLSLSHFFFFLGFPFSWVKMF